MERSGRVCRVPERSVEVRNGVERWGRVCRVQEGSVEVRKGL